jgi:radical SAM superfamily enzyme YgiQ (UPF0313 family)
MKVSLCSSPHLDHNFFYQTRPERSRAVAVPFPPLGLLSIAACLERQNVNVGIIDVNRLINGTSLESPSFYADLAGKICRGHADVLGFMTDADSYHHVLSIARECKNLTPGTRIVLGGPHASVTDLDTLDAFDFIDFIVRGEGETSMAELASVLEAGQDPGCVKGLSYRSVSGAVIRNDDRPLLRDLDALPVPAFHLYHPMPADSIYVEAGRGCPYSCTFCFTAPYWRRQYRVKSPARILFELSFLSSRYGIRRFHLVHDLFTTDKTWVETFCRDLITSGLSITWTCSSRTDTVNEQLLALMSRAGCTGIYYGLEVGSHEMQKAVRKHLDVGAAVETIRRTILVGIEVTAGIMLGFPEESEDSLKRSLELFSLLMRLGVPKLNVFRVCPFRGSLMHEQNRNRLFFEGHFFDFPIHRSLEVRNRDLMQQYPAIFSGYFRYKTQLEDDAFLKGIDELSPIMGLLRYPILAALDRGMDELEFLRRWAQWISANNLKERPGNSLTAYGTVDDFLAFLRTLVPAGTRDYLGDLIQYEETKNDLRKSLESGRRLPGADIVVRQFAFDIKDVLDHLVSRRNGTIEPKDCRILFFSNTAGELQTATITQ